jgi:Zn-dependent peptidase ImmA (M78 family)
MAKSEIEQLATMILEDYAALFRRDFGPPVPVEDIIERYFDLSIAFVDFERRYGQTDILGATYVAKRLICANANLDRPDCEGRLNFTFAHEAGHWVLHRRLVCEKEPDHTKNPLVLCRTRDAGSQIEWQANYFASCFLMPEACIQAAFEAAVGCQPLRLINETARLSGPCYVEPCVAHWPQIAGAVRQAGRFSNVSKQAIIIRLENLGLVVNETPVPMNWATVRELTLTA